MIEQIDYDDLMNEWEKTQNEGDPDEKIWTFQKILDHRTVGKLKEVKILWDDGSESWEPLSVLAQEDPVTCPNYAKEKGILHLPD